MKTSGHVDDAERVVAEMRRGFRVCFNAALADNPDVEGSMCITTSIGSNGEVVSATPSGGATMGEAFVSCVLKVARGATFAPPSGGAAKIVIPVSFTLAERKH